MRAEALFASPVQESEAPAPIKVREAIQSALLRHGPRGCAAVVAQEFGEHPNDAVRRMTWVLRMLRVAYPEVVSAQPRVDRVSTASVSPAATRSGVGARRRTRLAPVASR